MFVLTSARGLRYPWGNIKTGFAQSRNAVSETLEATMTDLEKNLQEYIHTRRAVCDAAIAQVGRAGAHEAVAELRVVADIEALVAGQPLPVRGAE